MRKPRITIILLTAFVAVLGSRSLLPQTEAPDLGLMVGETAKTSRPSAVALPDGSLERENTVAVTVTPRIPAVTFPAPTKELPLSDDANTLVSEMCSLHLLADKTDLSLSTREWSAFATVVLQIQAIRQTYEAQIATSQKIAPGQYRLEIPSYAGAGDALREKFHSELRTELGEAKAIDVLEKLGGRLEGHFAGFGVCAQTLDITSTPSGSFGDMEVTRTVTYWNSVEDSDRLTTRREIHYPAYEDPTGEGLSALLAVVKA